MRMVRAVGVVCGLVACTPVSYLGDEYDEGETLPKRPPESTTDETPAEEGKRPSARGFNAGVRDASPSCADGGCTAAPDASAKAPASQTFTLGPSDCSGGQCSGGYDGAKDARLLPTATRQCQDRGFARASDFTIGGQPGGRFCSYSGTGYGCDSSCDGCNVMKTVTCARP